MLCDQFNGLFDVKGLTDTEPSFGIGSSLFDKVTIQLNSRYYKGKEFVIEAKNNSNVNGYVQKLTLNDKQLSNTRIPFKTISNGGQLVLDMGSQPKDDYSK